MLFIVAGKKFLLKKTTCLDWYYLYSGCGPKCRGIQKISLKTEKWFICKFYFTSTIRLTLGHVLHPLRQAAHKQFSIGLRSGEWPGHFMRLMMCGASPVTTRSQHMDLWIPVSALWQGAVPCKKWPQVEASPSLDHSWFTIQNIHKKLARIKKQTNMKSCVCRSIGRNFFHVF